MYTNIPQKDLIQIIYNILEHNNTPKSQKDEIIILVKTILNQNYMQHIDHQYKQNERLAMGALTSVILAEIFIQYIEHNHIINILQRHHIIDYYRYVDDILNINNDNCTNIDDTLKEFNSIHPNTPWKNRLIINLIT
jgi:hypothetical protein